jgi:hypothetical protein
LPPTAVTRARAPVLDQAPVGNGRAATHRHGLTLSISSTAEFAKQLDKLVHKIAGDTEDAIVLERARAVAQSELELARVRRAKVALIERASAFGELDPPQLTAAGFSRLFNAVLRGRDIESIESTDASAAMPSREPDRWRIPSHRPGREPDHPNPASSLAASAGVRALGSRV